MTVYRCPRADLRCDALFGSSGDLDHHYRWTHGYRRVGRYAAAFRPPQLPPVGGRPTDQIATRSPAVTGTKRPAGVLPPGRSTVAAGGEPSGFGPAATAGAVRARHGRHEPARMGTLLRRFSRHR